jgi:hypothetical protein
MKLLDYRNLLESMECYEKKKIHVVGGSEKEKQTLLCTISKGTGGPTGVVSR